MSQIPFSPPQVQAALQNPTRFPDQKLQQYAKGQQPTGQVSPVMAQQEMATRNQERQAFQRQQAMQNNPENSPTIFQQKDMQMQQAMQALQQKEQQLGLAGAMLAKQKQDLAAREQGIAALPVNPNMFTAMDGGIVFSGGGGVEGYARRGLVQDLGTLEDRMAEGFTERGIDKMVDEEEADSLQQRIRNIERAAARRRQSAESALYSPEQKEELERKERDRLAAQYSKYKQGIAGLDEEAAAAIRGKPADIWQGIAAGLPTDTRGVRLAGLLAGVAKGVAGERGRADEREREAAKFLADAKRKGAAADLAEERNQDTLARALRKSEQDDRLKADELLGRAVSTDIESQRGIASLEETRREREQRARETAAKQAFDERKYAEEPARAESLARLRAKLERENRVPSVEERMFLAATHGMSKQEIADFSRGIIESKRGGAGADGRPTYSDYQSMVQKRLEGMTPSEITKLEKQNPGKTARQLIQQEVREELEFEFGKGLFKGQGGKGATPSAKTPPSVGTVMEGYKFKGGDPSKQENWEKV